LARRINLFEMILLPVGIAVSVFGFYMLIQANTAQDMLLWLKLLAIFNWLTLIFTVILSATNEDVKEELGLISKEHVEEIKLLKQIAHEELTEIKLLRQDLSRRKKKA